MSTTVSQVLQEAIQYLEASQIPEAQAAAEVLLASVLCMPRFHLYVEATRSLSAEQCCLYRAHLHRRQQGEPVQYITGKQEFWAHEFHVSPHVLIPRPESELLVEHGTRLVQQWCVSYGQTACHILDIGTGSGNLAISLAHMLPQSWVWGIDTSFAALQVAQANAQRLGVTKRVRWICGDLVTAWHNAAPKAVLCVANLPYITQAEWEGLPREIKDHEPRSALLGGQDGLESIQRLLNMSPAVLAAGGTLLLEVGWQQAMSVVRQLRQSGVFHSTGTYQDLAGIERVVWAQMPQ